MHRIGNQVKRDESQRTQLLGPPFLRNVREDHYIQYLARSRAVEETWRAEMVYRASLNVEPMRLADFERLSRLSHECYVAGGNQHVCASADGDGQCAVAGVVQDQVAGCAGGSQPLALLPPTGPL